MNVIDLFPYQLNLKVFGPHLYLKDEDKEYYQIAYNKWKEAWQEVVNSEMGVNSSVFYSDDFTRQDHIIALFDQKSCIGMAFMREVNLGINCLIEDSSFRFWPLQQLEKLLHQYKQVVIASYFTITPQYRRTHVEWKTLFLSLYLDYFSELGSKIMVTAARKLKSNEKLCYQLGAKPLLKDVVFSTKSGQVIERETIDLLFWENNHFSLLNPNLQNLRTQIWAAYKEKKDEQAISA
ncbi:MAG TPA: hypothetical protein VKY27_07560 [Bacteriovoracaceae bacterium]|nr:hypothetical protein [Bacteriovoracaceae bacterium]